MRERLATTMYKRDTAGLTFTYGFLENAGYPKLSMFVVWPVMGTVAGLVAIVRRAAGR